MQNLFLKTIACENVKTPPVWMMRQAGRYHKHYQALRARHSFMDLCLLPELAAEVAMGPVQDFDFDAAILFSDLLFPFKALGMGLDYTEQGPKLGFHLTSENIQKLKPWNEAVLEMEFQKKAMQITRERLSRDKALIGFVGGPWTLFVYAVEGSHQGSLLTAKKNLLDLWKPFMQIMRPFLIENIKLQFAGGADMIMLFDTAAGELSPALYNEFVVPELQALAASYSGRLGYYSKGTTSDHFATEKFKNINWAGQGFDHRFNMASLLTSARRNSFVQGNFDQALLHLPAADFKKQFETYLRPLADLNSEQRKGWVCGLGHGVLPKTPEENVRQFVQMLRKIFV